VSSPTPAVEVLQRNGVTFSLHEYAHAGGPVGAAEVADALELEPARVFKKLIVDTPDGNAVAIVAATATLHLKALARALGAKRAEMSDHSTAERLARSVVGAISPFGFPRPIPTVIDVSVSDHDTIFVSGGRRGLEIEIAPHDLVAVLSCATAPISRA
jgi:Cys-tRNA(Pro)/Cys-tRNA(Cys) deacylase